ncbi:MAG: hypothetical protein PHT62_01000 [Desulfotomaculaceae bacterium]|nr:hypothetical protein [Desulfotomaculaceae bacterium]
MQEGRKNLLELREELLTAVPSWARMKKPMIWLIGFGEKIILLDPSFYSCLYQEDCGLRNYLTRVTRQLA